MPRIKKEKETSGSRIVGLTLIHTAVEFAPQRPETEEFTFTYDAEIDNIEKINEDLFVFSAEYNVVKIETASERTVASFIARYYCGVKVSNLDLNKITDLAKGYASTSLWASFSSLAAVVTNQMQMDFPNLPASPSNIDVKKPKEEPDTAIDRTD